MATLYLLLCSESPNTFVIGVYHSLEQARSVYVHTLRTQRNLPKLAALYKKETGNRLPGDFASLYRLVIGADGNEDTANFFGDNVLLRIEEATSGTLYDFTNYCDWHERNLYYTLQMVLKGEIGTLDDHIPYATADIVLRSL